MAHLLKTENSQMNQDSPPINVFKKEPLRKPVNLAQVPSSDHDHHQLLSTGLDHLLELNQQFSQTHFSILLPPAATTSSTLCNPPVAKTLNKQLDYKHQRQQNLLQHQKEKQKKFTRQPVGIPEEIGSELRLGEISTD